MSWGTYIRTVLVPGVTFADARKVKELGKAIDTLRTEALVHAASNPPSAKQLNAEFADWTERFQTAVRQQADVCLVLWKLNDRKYMTDKRRWPKETPKGVLIHDVYFNGVSHEDILDWDARQEEEMTWANPWSDRQYLYQTRSNLSRRRRILLHRHECKRIYAKIKSHNSEYRLRNP